MTTAPTGQAVFDPFAPPVSTLPQPVTLDPVATDQVANASIGDQKLDDSEVQAPELNVSSAQINDQTVVQDLSKINLSPTDQAVNSVLSPANTTQVVTDLPDSSASRQDDQTIQDLLLSTPTESSEDEAVHENQLTDQTDQEFAETSTEQTDLQQIPSDLNLEQDFDLTEDERLALLDQVLTETEQTSSVFDQVMPAAIIANDPLNPQGAVSSSARKPETVASNSAPQEAGLIGQVEYEPSSELPVEVEGFLERVEDHADKLPQEIVIADEHAQLLPQSHPAQTVIMLPITAEDEEHPVKDVKLSLAWLLEWSHKIIKKFVGKVVYRHESNI